MQQKIWLINQYAMPPELEPRTRTIKFAHFLTEKGYDVTIIGGSSMHNTSVNLITDKKAFIKCEYKDIKFIHIRTRNYKNSFERVLNLFEFPIRLFKNYRKFERPDIIIHTATVPFGNILYYCAKRLKAKYIVEVLDLWPESFHQTGLVNKRNPLMGLLYAAEKWIYKKADKLVFSMEGGRDYIIEKKWNKELGGPIDLEKVSHINNGVDLEEFKYFKDMNNIDDSDLNNDNTFKVIYIGSIRLFNNVKLLIDSAKILMRNKKIKILIYGDGTERQMLINYVSEQGIDNVVFKDKFVDKKYIPYILSRSSLNILNYQQNGIWKYGGSQNKMFQYLASGKPVCSNINMGYCLIKRYNCGISNEFSTAEEYANAIESIVDLPENEYENMCSNATEAAKEYDLKLLTDKLINLF